MAGFESELMAEVSWQVKMSARKRLAFYLKKTGKISKKFSSFMGNINNLGMFMYGIPKKDGKHWSRLSRKMYVGMGSCVEPWWFGLHISFILNFSTTHFFHGGNLTFRNLFFSIFNDVILEPYWQIYGNKLDDAVKPQTSKCIMLNNWSNFGNSYFCVWFWSSWLQIHSGGK